MKKICIADRTIASACGGQAGLSFKEKVEIVRSLCKLGADVIELPAIEDEKADSLFIRTVVSFSSGSVVSVNAGITEAEVERAYAAVSGAAKPRLSIALPVSPALMEYDCHKKPAEVLELIKKLVARAASLCGDVEFCAVDATRAENDFLALSISAAISAGAGVVTVCDNEGCNLPFETEKFIKRVFAGVPGLKKIRTGYLCEDACGLGLASAVTAAICGVGEIKASVGVEGYIPLDGLTEFILNRGDSLGLSAGLSKTEFQRHANQIKRLLSAPKSDNSAFDKLTLVPQSDARYALTAKDDIAAVGRAVVKLGYDLSEDDKKKVYEEFLRAADKKPIGERELDAIVVSVALQVPQTYKLISYLINSGNLITASATVSLERAGETLQGISLGDGPIDAAFLAMERVIGRHYELDDFQIQAVTEGTEAMGSAFVKLRSGGKVYSGQGLSTDIIGASIRAYLSALNKIMYEEE